MSNLVQPILVTLDDSHERIVTAAARASLLACEDVASEPWATWLSGRFTKTVRRIKEKELAKLRLLDTPHVEVESGNMVAMAFEPMAYDAFPKLLKNAQVKGTEAPREAAHADEDLVEFMREYHTPLYLINEDLGMSTGKTAAQLAHAYWMAWQTSQSKTPESFPHPPTLWVKQEVFEKYKPAAEQVVTDAGLTELSGPTETVLVVKSHGGFEQRSLAL